MKTLRDEWFDGARCVHNGESCTSHTRRLLGKYGNYRVVEGGLGTIQGPRDRQPIVVLRQPTGSMVEAIGLGALGDTVKLLLPPEEKVQSDPAADAMRRRIGELEWQLIDESGDCELAYSNLRAERARADKYEAALREIEKADRTPSDLELAGLLCDVVCTARKALDDE